MDAEIKARWVEALRSSRYEQAQGTLRLDDTFCCLGVLCDVAGNGKWSPSGCYVEHGEAEESVVPNTLRFRASLSLDDEIALFHMNDDGVSFADIADFIEANP